jgi:tRNA-dihydrouridine synthase B
MPLLDGFNIGPIRVQPGLVLAPMEGHTDSAFRRLVKELQFESQGCGLVYSEMTTAGALIRGKVMERSSIKVFIAEERPLGFQVTGCDAAEVGEAARRFAALEPDFIDINMGCPSNNAGSSGHGAALLRDLEKAVAVIRAVIEAVAPLPVTLKMRAGWDEDSIVMCELGKSAEAAGIAALALHPRTKKQGYSGSAPWARIGELKGAVKIPVIGCGDVLTPQDALRMHSETGCDGVMVGRGALINPWIFRQTVEFIKTGNITQPTLDEKLAFIARHGELSLQVEPKAHKALGRMKGLAGQITKGMPRGALLRNRLNEVRSLEDFHRLVDEYRAELTAAA